MSEDQITVITEISVKSKSAVVSTTFIKIVRNLPHYLLLSELKSLKKVLINWLSNAKISKVFIPFSQNMFLIFFFFFNEQYNRGRRAPDSWVFGVLSTATRPAKGYYQVVERKDRATLLPILAKCLQPGSEVFTDDWGAYHNLDRHLPNHVSLHRVVIHADNFVDPTSGVHTQEAESAWNNLKLGIKTRRGVEAKDLQAYLNDRMWRQWRGGKRVLANFLPVIVSQFNDYIV